jgi:hypothetical protein
VTTLASRLKTVILAFVIICSSATEALSACPDLSGEYYHQGEDGYVIWRIRQVECSAIEISNERKYIGKITNTKLSLKADGIFRWVYGGLYAGREAYMIASRFVGNTFEITTVPPFSSKSKEGKKIGLQAMSLVDIYSLDSQRNLSIAGRHYDYDGKLTYEESVVVVRK